MNDKLKEILIRKITENIPANVKPVDYLTGILKLGKDSIYRRLNGQIDFSITEIAAIATHLNISLDEIHSEYDPELAVFNFRSSALDLPEKSVRRVLDYLCGNLEQLFKAEQAYILTAVNHLLFQFTMNYGNLWKFIYYKWIHQFDKSSLNFYKDMVIPEEITNYLKVLVNYQHQFKEVVILDKNIFYNTISEIKYYKESGLITNEEVDLIKEDIKDFIKEVQLILQTGFDRKGAQWEIYLSSINISSNSSYVNIEGKEDVYFYIYSDNSIYTSDPQMLKLQKELFESLKKYSTLITQSNQKMQVDFINQQYKYLNEL